MNILIISSTPKSEGLCASLVEAATKAARAAANVRVLHLRDYNLGVCKMCGDGWGACSSEHQCTYGADGLNELQAAVAKADALVLISPVYWGEVSESMKTFLDRLRRCEASRRFEGGKTTLTEKQVILVASPGGSGNGMLTTLEQLERAVRHMDGHVFDYIGVNRWNKTYKTAALQAAIAAMAAEHK